jgi:hypothetical protein
MALHDAMEEAKDDTQKGTGHPGAEPIGQRRARDPDRMALISVRPVMLAFPMDGRSLQDEEVSVYCDAED